MKTNRRALLGWLGAGLGTLVVPGCFSAGSEDEQTTGAALSRGFLAAYDALGETETGAALVGKRGLLVKEWLALRPAELFAELRAHRPVLHTGGPVPTLVALHEDVVSVMETNDVFTVAPYQREAQHSLDHFTLADADLERHDREKAVHQKAVTREDARAVVGLLRENAEDLVRLARERGDGRIDVVKDVAELLPVRLIDGYFGVPSGGAGEPSEATMVGWIGDMFRNFFLNLSAEPSVQAKGRQAVEELARWIDAVVARRPPGETMPADVLGRFVHLQKEHPDVLEGRITPNLVGIIAGAATGTVAKSIANVVDVLTSPAHADALALARRAADADDTMALWKIAREALRFRPQGIAIARVCTRPTSIRGVTIPAGALVLAGTASAMMDPAAFPDPGTFRTDRPEGRYLHMGSGRYECLGKHLAPVAIAEALRALLRAGISRRVDDTLVYGDVYPATFLLDLPSTT